MLSLVLVLISCVPQSGPAQPEAVAVARKQIDRADLGARVRWAQSARAAGLVSEALAELDAVLRIDADQADALALLREGRWVQLPADLEERMRWAGKRPGAPREIAIIEMERSTPREELLGHFVRCMASDVTDRREVAALGLRRVFPGEASRTLLLHAVYDPAESVQQACALGIRASQDPNLLLPLVRTLERSKSARARGNAARALGVIGAPAAVEPLVARLAAAQQSGASANSRIPHSHIFVGTQRAYVQDFDVEVAQFSSVADPIVNTVMEGAVLDAAVTGVGASEVLYECARIRSSLAQITGARPGDTNRAWLAWWKQHGARWMSAPSTPKAATR